MNFFGIGETITLRLGDQFITYTYTQNLKEGILNEGRRASDAIVRIVRILKFNTNNIQKQKKNIVKKEADNLNSFHIHIS